MTISTKGIHGYISSMFVPDLLIITNVRETKLFDVACYATITLGPSEGLMPGRD